VIISIDVLIINKSILSDSLSTLLELKNYFRANEVARGSHTEINLTQKKIGKNIKNMDSK